MTQTITLQRNWLTGRSTIGRLDVFGTDVYTLEDTKRPHKVFGETRIAVGRYKLELRNRGGMNSRFEHRFPDMHRGMIWLRRVPQFEWIYIHPGNTAADTLGCILVGMDHALDRLSSSVKAYRLIYPKIATAIQEGGCFINIFDELEEGAQLEPEGLKLATG